MEEELKDLVRFLAHAHMEWESLRLKALALPPEECKEFLSLKFPVMQGTRNRIALAKIGEQDCNMENVGKAIKYMNVESILARVTDGLKTAKIILFTDKEIDPLVPKYFTKVYRIEGEEVSVEEWEKSSRPKDIGYAGNEELQRFIDKRRGLWI